MKSNEQKNLILKQSFELFKKMGYEKTTTREIADACDMKRGLLHYYYPKKQDILFDIYSEFLTVLANYVKQNYENVDVEYIIIMIDKVYYEYIFHNDDMMKILVYILNSRDLTKIKVDKTIEIFEKIYDEHQDTVDKEQLFISLSAAIGAEVEILLNIIEGRINLGVDELMAVVVKTAFMLRGKSVREAEKLLLKSKKQFNAQDLLEIEEYLNQECNWR